MWKTIFGSISAQIYSYIYFLVVSKTTGLNGKEYIRHKMCFILLCMYEGSSSSINTHVYLANFTRDARRNECRSSRLVVTGIVRSELEWTCLGVYIRTDLNARSAGTEQEFVHQKQYSLTERAQQQCCTMRKLKPELTGGHGTALPSTLKIPVRFVRYYLSVCV